MLHSRWLIWGFLLVLSNVSVFQVATRGPHLTGIQQSSGFLQEHRKKELMRTLKLILYMLFLKIWGYLGES